MAFGKNPVTTTQGALPSNQIFPSSVAVPNYANGDLVALEGLAAVVDGNQNATSGVLVGDVERNGYVTASSPPAQTLVGNDTPYTFSSQVNRIIIQNNTSGNVNYAFDAVASAGSLVLVPGAMLVYPKKCTVLHLFTAAAQNINGNTANNLVVLGAL